MQALHNLCVVYVERGKLIAAEDCLKHVVRIAPNQEYIRRHLQYVQTRIANLVAGSKERTIAHGTYDTKFAVNNEMLSRVSRKKMVGVVTPVAAATTSTPIINRGTEKSERALHNINEQTLRSQASSVNSNLPQTKEENNNIRNYRSHDKALKDDPERNFVYDLDDPSSGMS